MRLLAFDRFRDGAVVAGESAVAGLAGLLLAIADADARRRLDLRCDSTVLVFGTEGATDPEVYRKIVGRTAEEVAAQAIQNYARAPMSNVSQLCAIVGHEIDDAREELVDLCGHLVAAASVNPPGRTAEAADVVRSYLAHHGGRDEVVARPMTKRRMSSGKSMRAGRDAHVVFNAHMDTMEAGDETAWTVPVMCSHPP